MSHATTMALLAISPLILVCLTVIVVMLSIAWQRNHTLSAILTAVGLNVALLALLFGWTLGAVDVTSVLVVDDLSRFGGVLESSSCLPLPAFGRLGSRIQ